MTASIDAAFDGRGMRLCVRLRACYHNNNMGRRIFLELLMHWPSFAPSLPRCAGRDRKRVSHHFHGGASAGALTAFRSSLRLAISFSFSSLLSPARLTAGEALGSSAVELLRVAEDDPLLSHASETGAGVGRGDGGVFDGAGFVAVRAGLGATAESEGSKGSQLP